MPSADETNLATECKKCEKRFLDPKTLKKHLRKTKHFVPMVPKLQDRWVPPPRRSSPGRDERNGRGRRRTTSRGPQARHHEPPRSPGHSSSSSRGSSSSLESSSSECKTSQGRGVGGAGGPGDIAKQSRDDDDGPVASEQRRSFALETAQEYEKDIRASTTTTTPRLSDGGSVTSRMSPRHSSSSIADRDLDEAPLEDQNARYPGST